MPILLIVDDEKLWLNLLEHYFALPRLEVHTAAMPVEALRLAEETGPDLVLCDVNMPDMDGFTLCRHIRHKRQGKPVVFVFMSGLILPEYEHEAREIGAKDFIAKSVNLKELRNRVLCHLELDYRGPFAVS